MQYYQQETYPNHSATPNATLVQGPIPEDSAASFLSNFTGDNE
jgi:hypothetical protein